MTAASDIASAYLLVKIVRKHGQQLIWNNTIIKLNLMVEV